MQEPKKSPRKALKIEVLGVNIGSLNCAKMEFIDDWTAE